VSVGDPYSEDWYRGRMHATRRSADAIAPFVTQLVHPTSIVDLGCGTGSWLAAFGIADVLGFDGAWVSRSQLEIPEERFQQHDLRQPLVLDRTFDLALSVEVGEHLPPEAASVLVASLTRLAPVVLFSAAIPHQGGTGHVNPQWPAYWAERFASNDYVPCDVSRPQFWCHPDVRIAHAQNLILYVKRDQLSRLELAETRLLPLVHPRLLQRLASQRPSLRNLLSRTRPR
jgi:SAM-dependent methyltransferase